MTLTTGISHVDRILDAGARVRVDALLDASRPGGWSRPDRHGVRVVARSTAELTPEELSDILTYRLAQYLLAGLADRALVGQLGALHEPLSSVHPDDLHVIAGSTGTRQILCYVTLRAPASCRADATLRTADRPVFPLETVYGTGRFDHLAVLPDLDVRRLREVGRLAKNHQAPALAVSVVRGTAETFLALVALLLGPLRGTVDGIIGDIDERLVDDWFDYLHFPHVIVRPPSERSDGNAGYLQPIWTSPRRRLFASLVDEFDQSMLSRIAAIERALDRPGREAALELLALRRTTQRRHSTLLHATPVRTPS